MMTTTLRLLIMLILVELSLSFHSQAPSSVRPSQNRNATGHPHFVRIRRKQNGPGELHHAFSVKSRLICPTNVTHASRSKDGNDATSSSSCATLINNRHSAGDWLYNLKSLPDSIVLKKIRNPVITLTIWATSISLVHKVLVWSGHNRLAACLSVSPVAHSFLVSSLGLLLVFRTNSAYQRFQEGRKIWEEILDISRNLSRLTNLYRKELGGNRLRRVLNLLASFPYLLRQHVRPGCLCNNNQVDDRYKCILQEPMTNVVDSRYEGDKASGGAYDPAQLDFVPCYVDRREMPWRLLDEGDILWNVARASNRPLWACDRLGHEIIKIPYSDHFTSRERLKMLANVDLLTNAIGQCERIHQTAVPLNYARHALRGLTLWCLTLPFCMVKDFGLLTGPATGIIAWLLFGVYQIGHSIEDPFQGSLRLSMLCDAIRRDILGDEEAVTPRHTAFLLDDSPLLPPLTLHTELAGQILVRHLTEGSPQLELKNGTWHVAR